MPTLGCHRFEQDWKYGEEQCLLTRPRDHHPCTLTQCQPDDEPTISRLLLIDHAGSERRPETNDKEAIREASTISTDRESLKNMFIAPGKRATGQKSRSQQGQKYVVESPIAGIDLNA